MMERLREAIEHCYEVAKDQCGNRCANEHIQLAKWLEDLQDFYALKEQGKLIELPCKPGDTVWLLHQTYTPKTGNAYGITEMKVAEQRGNELNPVWFIIDGEYGITSFSPSSIGKTVFLTEQEAMEAFEGMKKRK